MNEIAKEIASYLGSAEMSEEEFIEHYGMPRRSGRYPWGSGKDPFQHRTNLLSRIEELKKNGWTETPENIEKEFGISSTLYRREKRIAEEEMKIYKINTAKSLREDGLNNSEIGRKMGINESSVRSLFKQDEAGRIYQTRQTAEFLKERLKNSRHQMIDVGGNAELDLDMFGGSNISKDALDTALLLLEQEGYHVYGGRVPQPTNKDQQTILKILAGPDVPPSAIYEYDKIDTIKEYITRDGGKTFEKKFTYPESMDSKRMMVRYAEDGGVDKDGVVELRPGVQDLSLSGSKYSQVRILVDGSHYIKGMAVYGDEKDFPPGVDVIFNTNKSKSVPKMKVLKEIKNDPDNPFGSAIKDVELGGQYWYTDKNGNRKLGLINKRADEGDWSEWADKLPSQFLSKQSKQLAAKQLNLAKADKEAEFDEIMALTNPTVKKYYLQKFADSCDGSAVDLKAAALPGQKYHVIIPNNTLKDTEIYAPQYKPGTKLALVRYPHGGIFEIPILTVTDKNQLAKKLIGPASNDAVCITKKVADRLSGADFDGDTVMCIPTHDPKGKVKIRTSDELDGLKGFDPKEKYGSEERIGKDGVKRYYCGDREIKIMQNTNNEMGRISNLITDMTLTGGASKEELAAAVRHSMVVIDAEKHKLDYRRSAIDNNIDALKRKYQPKYDKDGNVIGGGGASTIVSKSKGQYSVPKRKGQARINIPGKPWYNPNKPEGSLIHITAPDSELYYPLSSYNKKTHVKTFTTVNGKTIKVNMDDKKEREKYEPVMKKDSKTGDVIFTNKDGSVIYKTKMRMIKSKNMAETDDAYSLVSKNRHPMEILYADYANHMKALANTARKEMISTGNLKYNSDAAEKYSKEVSELNIKLNNALKNSVKERAATRYAAAEIKKRKEDNPNMTADEEKKLSQRYMAKYRGEVGAISRKNRSIEITDKEWEAIQAGAISNNKLEQILNNSDPDILRERAMPKPKATLNTAQINRIKSMSASNFTLNQIAEKMNLSPSTVSRYLKGVK